ncbi:MAG: alpha/beta fold hydrolase, partial [Caulobacterales bacterium]
LPHRPRPADTSGLAKNLRLGDDGRWRWHWDPKMMEMQRMGREERLEDCARALKVPTLLIRGQKSDLLSPAGARAFLDLVPHAEFVDIEGADHMVAGDRNDAFNAAVFEFLQRQTAKS